MNISRKLKVKPGDRTRLADRDPDDTFDAKGKQAAQKALASNVERLAELQRRLYAESRRSLLIVLQGMDSSGKDGTIRHVMSGMNPQSCRVTSFKVPSAEEMSHDFLWRIHKALPAKGEIGIFNRSHYEDIVAVRVEKLAPAEVWAARYEAINNFEAYLARNGVTILKFFLHISKGEQKKRLLERLKDPAKNWKADAMDFRKRKRWNAYMEAYEEALSRCSTRHAPWYVIPSNQKWFRNLAVSEIIAQNMERMDPRYPRLSFDPADLPK